MSSCRSVNSSSMPSAATSGSVALVSTNIDMRFLHVRVVKAAKQPPPGPASRRDVLAAAATRASTPPTATRGRAWRRPARAAPLALPDDGGAAGLGGPRRQARPRPQLPGRRGAMPARGGAALRLDNADVKE